MKTRLLPVLLLTAAFPLAAAAQDNATPPGTNDTTPGTTQTQPGNDAAPTTNPSDTAPSMQQDMDSPAATPAPSTGDTSPAMDGSTAMPSDHSAATTGETFVTVPETGAWRVSDLQGKAVYDSEGNSIGDIKDVLVSQNGSVNAVIIGVGGFLGIGEKNVAVNMSALQLGPGDTQAKADAVTTAMPNNDATGSVTADNPAIPGQGTTAMDGTGTMASPPAASADMAANNPNAAKIGDDALPDRIILNVTRQQLEDAPAFEGVRAQP
ncbi:PRC-barrel domain-containing protein [Pleomorphomonas koreensis]|uniref:PRC-barrel domain-containing protein n=1 Tax=Pleomorphomonas koreensis TaxID=257440 RepID=UPI00069E4637|nr:PRC-barrel domain-containing protein [Pleomorphomonas koreensis]